MYSDVLRGACVFPPLKSSENLLNEELTNLYSKKLRSLDRVVNYKCDFWKMWNPV